MIYLLDTDHISLLQRGGAESEVLVQHLLSLPPDDYGTTIVSYEEQCRGWTDYIHRSRTAEARLLAYAQLSENLRFFSSIAVWEYTQEAEVQFSILLKAKLKTGTQDLKIAAIALANNATLLTRNTRHFIKVPGLRIEDWTV